MWKVEYTKRFLFFDSLDKFSDDFAIALEQPRELG
jgi:hypothetical protein